MVAPYIPLFRACSTLKSIRQLHAYLIVLGFHGDLLASTKLIGSYSEMGCVYSANKIFGAFKKPDSFMWGVLIKCHVWNGLFEEAILLYEKVLESLNELSSFVFPSVLRACSAVKDLSMGERIHARILKSGFESDTVIETALLSMYGENGCSFNARKLFDSMATRDVVSWSSIVSNYVRDGQPLEGLEIFREMVREGIEIDSVTLLSIAEACGEMGFWHAGRSCHGYVIRRNIGSDHDALGSSLIAMYGKCGDTRVAERLFFYGAHCNIASWTALISCYNQNGCYSKAIETFIEMQKCDVGCNSVTLMSIVCSCARVGWLRQGKSVHGYAIRNNIDLKKDFLRSSLIDLYANCGNVGYGHLVFNGTQEKHIVSWNILISGYAREGMSQEALSLFGQMLTQGVIPDSFSLASALLACRDISFFGFGCQIHCLAIKSLQIQNEFVENTLIHMYSNCGSVNSASRIFQARQERSTVTWNTMLCGFSQNGYSEQALFLFTEMFAKCINMDQVTFTIVLQACADQGLVDRGRWIHHKLLTSGLTADVYTGTALINMYARCGDLQMAQRVFSNMTERSPASWSSIIGGYAMHGHIDDSIALFDQMIKSGVEPNDITFMSILSACSHAGYVEKGKYYFNSLVKDYGINPSSEHYACLVDMLSRSGDLKGAYEVLDSMPFPSDARTWGALVNGCRIHNRVDFLNSINRNLIGMEAEDSGYYKVLANVYADAGKWNEFMMVRAKIRSMTLKNVHGCSMIET